MQDVSCQFRQNIQRDGVDEFATCQLLKLLSGVNDDRLCRVRRDACVACCAESFLPAVAVNSVITSLLYNLSQQLVNDGGGAGLDVDRAESLREWTEECLSREPVPGIQKIPSCDVILICRDSSQQTRCAIESILDQEDATTVVHLVDDGGHAGEVIRQFEDRWNVVTHSLCGDQSLAVAYALIPEFRTEFVAIQDSATMSCPDRIATAVRSLQQQGSEVFVSAMATTSGEMQSRKPANGAEGSFLTPTLVMRRATLIDVSKLIDGRMPAGHVDDFDRRVYQQGYRVSLDSRALVQCHGSWQPESARTCDARDRQVCPQQIGSIACDVVLPFHGHLDYVEESIQGLMNQENADVVIHLVDDASSEDTSDLLRRWRSDRRLRVYRNQQNLGQYTSFNNIFPFLETELVAVQDADDVSLPNRISYSGNCLKLSDTEVFSAACDLVVDESCPPVWSQNNPPTSASCVLTNKTRYSHYPIPAYGCFLLNPTMMIRKELFGRLGGFADYRQLLQNRGGLDTEFFQRAYWSGARFFVSRRKLVKMRVHRDSATKNSLTGFGSPARRASNVESRRRTAIFSKGLFEPRTFGGLGNYSGLTKRL